MVALDISNLFILFHAHHISFHIIILNCDDIFVTNATHKSLQQIDMDKRRVHNVPKDKIAFLEYELKRIDHPVRY